MKILKFLWKLVLSLMFAPLLTVWFLIMSFWYLMSDEAPPMF